MKEVIKNILDEYSKSSSQVNFESDSARNELATYITKQMLNWQAENIQNIPLNKIATYKKDIKK